jgi:PAS domain S-box-containing protein
MSELSTTGGDSIRSEDVELEASSSATPLEDALRELSNVGVFRADASGCCTSVNEHWCRITGYEREDVLGRSWFDMMASEDSRSRGELWQALQAGLSHRRTRPHRRPDGREVWIETQTLPEVDGEGQVTGVITTLLDVTARRRAEEEAREREENLRRRFDELESLYQHAPVGLSVLDRELRFVRVNERFASFTERSVEEHLGHRLEEVVPRARPGGGPGHCATGASVRGSHGGRRAHASLAGRRGRRLARELPSHRERREDHGAAHGVAERDPGEADRAPGIGAAA